MEMSFIVALTQMTIQPFSGHYSGICLLKNLRGLKENEGGGG